MYIPPPRPYIVYKKRASLIRVMKRGHNGGFLALIKVLLEIKTDQNFYYFFGKENKRVPFFFISKGLNYTVGTPFHNEGKGQKRSLQKSQKKGQNFRFYTVFATLKGFHEVKIVRTQNGRKKSYGYWGWSGPLPRITNQQRCCSSSSFLRSS